MSGARVGVGVLFGVVFVVGQLLNMGGVLGVGG